MENTTNHINLIRLRTKKLQLLKDFSTPKSTIKVINGRINELEQELNLNTVSAC